MWQQKLNGCSCLQVPSVEIFKITGLNNELKKTYNEKDIALFVVQF